MSAFCDENGHGYQDFNDGIIRCRQCGGLPPEPGQSAEAELKQLRKDIELLAASIDRKANEPADGPRERAARYVLGGVPPALRALARGVSFA